MFASNDGKELSLTFYSVSGARIKRVTIPKPDFTPISMTVTKRGHLFLCSPTEILCLDSDFSDLASLGDLEGLEPRCLSGLKGMGSGVGDALVANWAAGNVEVWAARSCCWFVVFVTVPLLQVPFTWWGCCCFCL